MSQSTVLPKISGKAKSTRDLIISVLSEQWPLSAKQVSEKLKHCSDGSGISYQAVHKLLLQLCGEKVLEKKGTAYQLSKSWVAGMRTFFTSLEQRYGGKEEFISGLAKFKGSFEFTFNNLTDFALSMAEFLVSDRCVNAKKVYRIAVLRHGWWTLTFNFDHFIILRKIGKLNPQSHIIMRKNFPFTRWLNKQYNHIGLHSKVIEGMENYDDDIIVIGQLIVQVNYSDETKSAIDKLYSKISGLTELFKQYAVSSLPEKKIEIHFKITENPALAATLGKHYMDIWNSH